jgi:hypothetical protein
MWSSVLAMVVAIGFGFVTASGVSAAPANGSALVELAHRTNAVIQVRDGCGRGRHRNMGHCVPGADLVGSSPIHKLLAAKGDCARISRSRFPASSGPPTPPPNRIVVCDLEILGTIKPGDCPGGNRKSSVAFMSAMFPKCL